MNPELPALHRQALDNLYSYVGVWLSIAGGIIGSAGRSYSVFFGIRE